MTLFSLNPRHAEFPALVKFLRTSVSTPWPPHQLCHSGGKRRVLLDDWSKADVVIFVFLTVPSVREDVPPHAVLPTVLRRKRWQWQTMGERSRAGLGWTKCGKTKIVAYFVIV